MDSSVYELENEFDSNYKAEEVQVAELVDELRSTWEKMEPGVDTCYTFEGELGLEILTLRRRNRELEEEKEAIIEKCATIAEKTQHTPTLLLMAGEMTAQEIRSAKAVTKWIATTIRNLKSTQAPRK